jgi:hypothetical protein
MPAVFSAADWLLLRVYRLKDPGDDAEPTFRYAEKSTTSSNMLQLTELAKQLRQAGQGFAAIRSTTQIGRKYAELAAMRASGTLRLSPATSPSDGHTGYFPYATDNYTLVQECTLPCYQAALVHATTLTLEHLGIEKMPIVVNDKRDYRFLQHLLGQQSQHCASPWQLRRCRRFERASDIFLQDSGVFLTSCDWYDFEDCDWELAPEAVPHYAAYNAGTGLLCMYPECVVVLDEDKQDLCAFFEKLKQPPYQMRFPTARGTETQVRQLFVSRKAATLPPCAPSLREAAATWQ